MGVQVEFRLGFPIAHRLVRDARAAGEVAQTSPCSSRAARRWLPEKRAIDLPNSVAVLICGVDTDTGASLCLGYVGGRHPTLCNITIFRSTFRAIRNSNV